MYKNIKKLWIHIGKIRRLQFKLLIVLIIVASITEILSIGAVFPFFGVLMNPNKILDSADFKPFLEMLNINSTSEVVLTVTILFCLSIILAAATRIFMTWICIRMSFAFGTDLSNDIYRRTLYQPYSVHVSRNSGDVINGIWLKVSEVIFYVLMPITTLVNSGVLSLIIIITLIVVTPNIALIAMGGLGLIYGLIIRLTKKKLNLSSVIIARESNNIIKNLQEGLSGIRDVLIDGSQETFCATYKNTNAVLRRAQGNNQIITFIPSFVLASLAMALIGFLSYRLTLSGGFSTAMPSLVALTLGIQRLLPNAQQLYASWSAMNGSHASLQDVIEFLEQPYPENINKPDKEEYLPFEKNITLDNISFRYNQEKPWVLNKFSLSIKKGSRLGFIGTTGCGKSTLLDIVMGLLKPKEGSLIVDGQVINEINCRAWQKHISHVPQNVFLADNTIESNIAFGVPSHLIDKNKVRNAAKKAQLSDLIETWPNKYETRVGERGIQLSGGQCQRIGIARALYKEADVIILDEATSALDGETEREVIASIEALSKDITILVIAHRLNTLDFCTEIIELEQEGKIKSHINK